jgi:hypothetical protein
MFIVRTIVPQKTRKKDLIFMKNAVHTIGIILVLLGIILTMGIVGGLEHDTCTWSQFWTTLAISVPMTGVGIKLIYIGEQD